MKSILAHEIIDNLRKKTSNNTEIAAIVKKLQNIECEEGSDINLVGSNIIQEIEKILASETQDNYDHLEHIVGCSIWFLKLQQLRHCPQFKTPEEVVRFANGLLELFDKYHHNTNVQYYILISLNYLFVFYGDYSRDSFIQLYHIKHHGLVKYLQISDKPELTYIGVQNFYSILFSLKNVKLTSDHEEIFSQAGLNLMQILRDERFFNSVDDIKQRTVLRSLQLLHIIVENHSIFAQDNASQLFDLLKSYLYYGSKKGNSVPLKNSNPQIPMLSLPSIIDEDVITVKCSPISKNRRKICKNLKPKKQNHSHPGAVNCKYLTFTQENIHTFTNVDLEDNSSDLLGKQCGRTEEALVRLTSTYLISCLVRTLQPKNLYSYWTKLFPYPKDAVKDDLLSIARYETNTKCRLELLVTCTQLLYLFKEFLQKAEVNQSICPPAFVPFSITLGLSIKLTFEHLKDILSNEKSMVIIAQALKCIASLVQVTPFQQFDNTFLKEFIIFIKPYINSNDFTVQTGGLMVFENLIRSLDMTSDLIESLGFSIKSTEMNNTVDYSEQEIEKPGNNKQFNSIQTQFVYNNIDETAWLLLAITKLFTKNRIDNVPSSLRIQALKVLIVLSSHFNLMKPYLSKLTEILISMLSEQSSDIRLYAIRSIDAFFLHINQYLCKYNNINNTPLNLNIFDSFWVKVIPILLSHVSNFQGEEANVKVCLFGSLSNIGEIAFERLSYKVQMDILTILTSVSCDTMEEPIVRAEVIRTSTIFLSFSSLCNDLVFMENTIDAIVRSFSINNLLARIKIFWSLANVSEALINTKNNEQQSPKNISNDLIISLINKCVLACTDHDKIQYNAVRSLGNLLRFFQLNATIISEKTDKPSWYETFKNSFNALLNCLKSSKNPKVKWNACYAISYILSHVNESILSDLKVDSVLFPLLCKNIVHNSNFKVRIGVAYVICNIEARAYFGKSFETFWCALLQALEQSFQLDNYHEYNHRDNLQEQICLAIGHLLSCSTIDDLIMLKRCLQSYIENIRDAWIRVINRMIPEKSASLLNCILHLNEFNKQSDLNNEQMNAVQLLSDVFKID